MAWLCSKARWEELAWAGEVVVYNATQAALLEQRVVNLSITAPMFFLTIRSMNRSFVQ